jgi:hypothetical protein
MNAVAVDESTTADDIVASILDLILFKIHALDADNRSETLRTQDLEDLKVFIEQAHEDRLQFNDKQWRWVLHYLEYRLPVSLPNTVEMALRELKPDEHSEK